MPAPRQMERPAAEVSAFLKQELEAPEYGGAGVELPGGCIAAPAMERVVVFGRFRALEAARLPDESVRVWERAFAAGLSPSAMPGAAWRSRLLSTSP
eukprot:tig00020616_g12249.t1